MAEAEDTTGAALIEWSYDTWTVPWVQAGGGSKRLDPASHATLMSIACENSLLERDRKVRHMSPEDCEHHMAKVRADHDTALVFRVALRVLGRAGASKPVWLGSRTTAVLEAADGWRWSPVDLKRGLRLGMATRGESRSISLYRPHWMRGGVGGGRGTDLDEVEYWVRFPRRDPAGGQRMLTRETRWLRLRLSDGDNQWVATWPFLPDEVRAP